MSFFTDTFFKLMSIDSPTGYTDRAADYVIKVLEDIGYKPQKTLKGGVICCLGGEGDAMIFSAHIDTLGGMVCEVKSNGRLRLTKLGGLQPQNIETENCRVYTRDGKVYTGCFQLNDPSVHVNGKYSTQERSFDTMEVVLDEVTSSKDETKKLGIDIGDIVAFDPRTMITDSGYIKSRFLDDKLSVVMLLDFARQIKEEKLRLRRKVYIYITNYEEVGHGCSSALPEDAVEIVCVDMGCVGSEVECTEHQVSICAKDTSGPSDYGVTTALVNAAKAGNIDYALDVYPLYGSDADAALRAGANLRHSLIGSGVYASHGYERTHMDGVKNTIALIRAYTVE